MSYYDYSDSDIESSNSPQILPLKPDTRSGNYKDTIPPVVPIPNPSDNATNILTAPTMSSMSSLDRLLSNTSIDRTSADLATGTQSQKVIKIVTNPAEIATWKCQGLEQLSKSAIFNIQHSHHLAQPLHDPAVFSITPKLLRKYVSTRPPPSSPPEYVLEHSLSHPTIPALHHNSVPELIELFRAERTYNPPAFDVKTQSIKDGLIAAKVERGGTPLLLLNEYTAELASRLDAEMTEKWLSRAEKEYCYSDDEGLEMNYPTSIDSRTEHVQSDIAVRVPPSPVIGHDGKEIDHLASPVHLAPSSIQGGYEDSQHGSICHQSCQYETVDHNGRRMITRRTFIIISETKYAGDQDDKPGDPADIKSVGVSVTQQASSEHGAPDLAKPGDHIKESLDHLNKLAHEQDFEAHGQLSADVVRLVQGTREKLTQLEDDGKVAYSTAEE